MSADIRDYLIERFRGDAETLRARAASLAGVKKPSPGPDAALSTAMAVACDDVVGLAEQLPVNAPLNEIVSALQLMVPELTTRANAPASMAAPAIRSVYAGACTRVQELISAETSAMNNDALALDGDEYEGELLDDDLDVDDPDADDDDLLEDDE
ncbi:MAG: hypothetical protein ABI852_01125 [Gemmatimonadaceae bacterium]